MLKFFQKMKKRREENDSMLNASSFFLLLHIKAPYDCLVNMWQTDFSLSNITKKNKKKHGRRRGRGAMKTI